MGYGFPTTAGQEDMLSLIIQSRYIVHRHDNILVIYVHQRPLNVDTVQFSTVIIWLHTSAVVTNLAGPR